MADLVCDTNVFYNIAAGTVSPARLRELGHRILLTPVSVLELVSHVTEENFADRRAAARAALEHHDEMTVDPEALLAEYWGIDAEPGDVDWLDGLRAFDGAASFEALSAGVPDYGAGVIRRLNVPLARGWRGGHYDDFEQQVIAAVDEQIPGYARARERGRMRQANRAQVQAVEQQFSSPAALAMVMVATRERAVLGAAGAVQPATADEFVRAADLLWPYALVYTRYFVNVATTRYAPQPNDFGDLECFLYLTEGRMIATSEHRWLNLAADVGLDDRVIDPQDL